MYELRNWVRRHWKWAALLGLLLVAASLALLAAALQPAAEPLRLQATLAPGLLLPPGVAP